MPVTPPDTMEESRAEDRSLLPRMSHRQPLFSLGMKMMFLTSFLLVMSFILCTVSAFYFSHPTARFNMETLQDLWATLGPLGIALFCTLFILTALALLGINQQLISRPFHRLQEALEDTERHGHSRRWPLQRSDEWGVLAGQLQQFVKTTTHHQDEARLLYETSRLLVSPLDLKTGMTSVLAELAHRFHSKASIVFWASRENELQVFGASGVSEQWQQQVRIKTTEGVLGKVFQSAEPLVLSSLESFEKDPLVRELEDRQGIRSAYLIPLTVEGRTLGVFGLFGAGDPRLSDLEMISLQELTHPLALALYNHERVSNLVAANQRLEVQISNTVHELTQTNARLVQKIREIKALYHVTLATASPGQFEEIVRVVVEGIKSLLDVEHGAFFLVNSSTGLLEPLAPAFDQPAPQADILRCTADGSSFLTQVIQKGEPQILNFVDNPTQLPATWKSLNVRSLVGVPLRQGETIQGFFCAMNKVSGLFTEDDVKLLMLLTQRVADVLERIRLDERLRQNVQDLQAANRKLEQMHQLKNEFLSMVSHELRTPLTTIKGFVSIVFNEESGALNAQQHHFLDTANRAIDRLTLLVSDLLDISRIEAGQIKMELRPVHLQELFLRVKTHFERPIKAQGLDFVVDLPERLPTVQGDPLRLTQVLENLISNAIKFTAKGSIVMTAQDKGDFVMVSVQDTGIGIPKDEQERIFDKFYQVRTGQGFPSQGTGLGLAIVKSIVESHRGRVWVESEPGKGSDFRFLLPRARTESLSEKVG